MDDAERLADARGKGMTPGKLLLILASCFCLLLLLIGGSCVALGLLLTGYETSNNLKLDKVHLSRIAEDLREIAEDPERAERLRAIPEKKSFAKLASVLYTEGLLPYERIKNLAGNSGVPGSQDDYRKPEHPDFSIRWCIFTGPRSGEALYQAVTADPANEIFLIYNTTWLERYKEDGVIFVKVGETMSRDLDPEAFRKSFRIGLDGASFRTGALKRVSHR